MAEYVSMIPGGGWRARLELKDGGSRDTPVIGWAMSDNGAVAPFFYPAGSWCALELSPVSVAENPHWGVTSFRLYHPGDRTQDAGRPPAPGSHVVHLMLTDIDDPDWADDVFTRCCGINWRAVIASGTVTSRRDLVTCPGRPKVTPG